MKARLTSENVTNYIGNLAVVQLAMNLFNLWASLVILSTLLCFLLTALAFTPVSLILLLVFAVVYVMLCLSCILPVTLIIAVPLIVIGYISSLFFILIY